MLALVDALSFDNRRISGVIIDGHPVLDLRSSVFLQFQVNIDIENTAVHTQSEHPENLKQTKIQCITHDTIQNPSKHKKTFEH